MKFNQESSNGDVAEIIEGLNMNLQGVHRHMGPQFRDRMQECFAVLPHRVSANALACLLNLGCVSDGEAKDW